jgi:iron(III) transport system substrate-binding protein
MSSGLIVDREREAMMSMAGRARLGVALFFLSLATPVLAQDVPALKGLDGDMRANVLQMIEGAKKEGSLNYSDTIIQPTTNDVLVAAFKTYYGLASNFPVNYTLLTSGAMITRIEQELAANRITFDVAAIGSPTWTFERYRAGAFMRYRSHEYDAYQDVIKAGLGVDGSFVLNGGYAQIPIWNADILKFDGKSYRDVLNAAVPGRFSIGDVVQSESHLTTYAGLRQVLDVEFFKEVAKKKPTFVGRSEQSAQRILTGQDVIAFGGNPSRVHQSNQKGAKLRILYPAEGFTFLPQLTFVLAKAPHPNAAKLWIDFVLSEKGQQILAEKEALISGRKGFKSPIPAIAPDFASLKIIPVDWEKITADRLMKYREEWITIFNP